jgi:DNA-binding MltR family transcriptional regulator
VDEKANKIWTEAARAVEFLLALARESDRGCALMAAAYIDSQIGELLRATLVKEAKVVEALLGQTKPLGTFSARIDMVYAIGLIGMRLHHDLHLIRKIRNDFGHVPDPICFNDTRIASRCKEFYCDKEESGSPRLRFIAAATRALAIIQGRTKNAKPPDAVQEPMSDDISKALYMVIKTCVKKLSDGSESEKIVIDQVLAAFRGQ